MEVTERVPITSKEGKQLKLTLDTETRKIKIEVPPMWGNVEVDVTTLKARIDDLSSLAGVKLD